MAEGKKNARSDVGASERAMELGQVSRQVHVSTHNDTTSPPTGQRVSDYLGEAGESLSNENLALKAALARMKRAEQEREAKRREIEGLTIKLLGFDSEDLGNAVKCYITEGKDTSELSDAAYDAFSIIAKIKVLEWEC